MLAGVQVEAEVGDHVLATTLRTVARETSLQQGIPTAKWPVQRCRLLLAVWGVRGWSRGGHTRSRVCGVARRSSYSRRPLPRRPSRV